MAIFVSGTIERLIGKARKLIAASSAKATRSQTTLTAARVLLESSNEILSERSVASTPPGSPASSSKPK
jgi:hypothetical protein